MPTATLLAVIKKSDINSLLIAPKHLHIDHTTADMGHIDIIQEGDSQSLIALNKAVGLHVAVTLRHDDRVLGTNHIIRVAPVFNIETQNIAPSIEELSDSAACSLLAEKFNLTPDAFTLDEIGLYYEEIEHRLFVCYVANLDTLSCHQRPHLLIPFADLQEPKRESAPLGHAIYRYLRNYYYVRNKVIVILAEQETPLHEKARQIVGLVTALQRTTIDGQ